MLERLKRHAPVGMDIAQEGILWLVGNIGSFIVGFFIFLDRYLDARYLLFSYPGGKQTLVAGALIAPFWEIAGHCYMGFPLVCFCLLGFIAYHYAYFRQGSMSIYLMKRLPKKSTLHRQALTLPCLGILATFLVAASMLLVCCFVYLLATPRVCLPDDIWRLS